MTALLLVLLVLACADSPAPPGDSTGTVGFEDQEQEDDQGSPGLDELAEEQGDEDDTTGDSLRTAQVLGLQDALASAMPTVVSVTWTQDVDAEVLYHDGETLRRSQGVRTDSGHQAWLVGAAPGSELTYWLEGTDADQSFTSEDQVVTTGSLIVEPVAFELGGSTHHAVADGLVLASWFGSDQGGAALFNRDGEPVWATSPEPGYQIVSAAWLSEGLWTLQESLESSFADSLVAFTAVDGTTDVILDAPYAHHDLTVLPQGGVAWIQADIRDTEAHGPVVGDCIVVAESNGELRVVTSTWDHLDPEPNRSWDSHFYEEGWDWTHGNGLTYSAQRDTFLLSLAGPATVMELDAKDGHLLWSFEGDSLDLAESAFLMQHSPTWTASGNLMLFVNVGVESTGSWAAEFELDDDGPREVWNSGRGDVSTSTVAMGRAARLPTGTTLVNYGNRGVVEEVDEDGELLWSLALPPGWMLGQTELVDLYEL